MSTSMKIGAGVIAACAACCAASVVSVLLAGTSIAALAEAAWAWGGGLTVLAAVASGLSYVSCRKALRVRADSGANRLITQAGAQGCGCGPVVEDRETPLACTLEAGDFKDRAAEIGDLARRALRDAKRTPLTLTLTYAPEAADEVQALKAKEQECCPFLTFELTQTADAVELTIRAPASAREAADALFDHFAPELVASKEIAR